MKKISLFLAAVMILFCITPVLEGQAAENSVYQTIFEDSFDTQSSLEHWKFVDNKNADAVMTV